jgi:DNA-binding response OmpR family regulator
MVELHGGSVRAKSGEDLTTFTVELPVGKEDVVLIGEHPEPTVEGLPVLETDGPMNKDRRPEEFEPIKEVVPENDIEPSDPEKVQILVVEDNPDLRGFISSILSEEYSVQEAGDGEEGFQKAEATIPDLIISDVMMPKMDGYELCKLIKSNEKTDHIPVVLLTAKASRENKMEGLELGADDYLVKPFDKEELLVRIRNLITIREKLQKKYQQEIRLKPKGIKVASVHQKFIEGIKEVIEENIGNEQFGVEDLASAMAMSRSQMHRKLKALTDRSASAFIRNYRLYRAAELIEQEAGNISEIAYDVGFNSQTYFSTCFQGLFGCTPSEYKAKEMERSGS